MEVPAVRTPLTGTDMLEAYGRAWLSVFAANPLRETILVLCAQTWMETGGVHLYNNNFGNTKAHDGLDSMVLRTREVINGQSVMMDCHFASFPTPAAGAEEQLRFIAVHYPTCLDAALRGDPVGFANEAHRHGYFTGELPAYAAGMASSYHHFLATLPASSWELEIAADAAAPQNDGGPLPGDPQ